MPIACEPDAIATASKCFCFPEKEHRGAVVYLLNQISGLNLTPDQLAAASAKFQMNEKSSEAAMLYLVCNIANA